MSNNHHETVSTSPECLSIFTRMGTTQCSTGTGSRGWWLVESEDQPESIHNFRIVHHKCKIVNCLLSFARHQTCSLAFRLSSLLKSLPVSLSRTWEEETCNILLIDKCTNTWQKFKYKPFEQYPEPSYWVPLAPQTPHLLQCLHSFCSPPPSNYDNDGFDDPLHSRIQYELILPYGSQQGTPCCLHCSQLKELNQPWRQQTSPPKCSWK